MTNTMTTPRRRGRPPGPRLLREETAPLGSKAEERMLSTVDDRLPMPVPGTIEELHRQEADLLNRVLRDRASLNWHRACLERTVELIHDRGGQPLSEIGRE